MIYESEYSRKINDMYDKCERLMNYHVILTTNDGEKIDGIIEKVEPDCVILLVGEDVMQDQDNDMKRQPSYGNNRWRYRRFRRRPFPYGGLGGISVLPYPYYLPPYPYYPF